MRFAVTPLTTVSVGVELERDRFDTSTIRDSNSWRILPAAEFAPDAVITGRVAAGFRHFDPRDARVEAFERLRGIGERDLHAAGHDAVHGRRDA